MSNYGANTARASVPRHLRKYTDANGVRHSTKADKDAADRRIANEQRTSEHRSTIALAQFDDVRRLDNAADTMRAVRSGATAPYVLSSVPTSGARAFVGLHTENVPRPQARPLPSTGEPEAYALARIDQIAARDGSDRTAATLKFGYEEPDAYARYREAYFGRQGQLPATMKGVSGEAAVKLFENMVEDARRKDVRLDAAAAISKVAAEHPDLAHARTRALSIPVGPGGIALSDR